MKKWMEEYCRRIEAEFGKRIRFIGLQGSYARGEQTESSDIDVVCVLDKLMPGDIGRYRAAIEGMQKRELICGFLSGWDELLHWEAADLFMFCYDTVPYAGSLEELKGRIDADAVDRAMRIGAGNIYHGCVHNMVHAQDEETLRALYKAAVFVLRAAVLRRTGEYARRNDDLRRLLNPEEMKILQTHAALKNGTEIEFEKMSAELFEWAKGLLV